MFTAAEDSPADCQIIPFEPAQLNAQDESNWLVPYRHFVDSQPCPKTQDMVTRIQRHYQVLAWPACGCVLIQRRDSRVLHATETGARLEEWLSPHLEAASIQFTTVVFEPLDPLDQWRAGVQGASADRHAWFGSHQLGVHAGGL